MHEWVRIVLASLGLAFVMGWIRCPSEPPPPLPTLEECEALRGKKAFSDEESDLFVLCIMDVWEDE